MRNAPQYGISRGRRRNAFATDVMSFSNYFGDGSDGDVTISSPTTLTTSTRTIGTTSRARATNVATIVTSSSHGMCTGDVVDVSGMSGSGYNAAGVTITVLSNTSFSYSNTGGDEGTTGDTGGTITTGYDNDMIVKNYNNLTVNSTLTPSKRCKGMLLYVLGDLAIGGSGVISMTGYGAYATPPTRDLVIIRRKAGSADYGMSDLVDCGAVAIASEAKQPFCYGNAKKYIIRHIGAKGGRHPEHYSDAAAFKAGYVGDAGVNSTGGGGSGGYSMISATLSVLGGEGARGTAFSGGAGGGGTAWQSSISGTPGFENGGRGGAGGNDTSGYNDDGGGGAGNPGGKSCGSATAGQNGTGGLVIIIVKGSVTITAGGIIQADGKNGGDGSGGADNGAGGGGSGGGYILLLYGGTLTNNGTIRANGGAGGLDGAGGSTSNGGAGGAGQITYENISA